MQSFNYPRFTQIVVTSALNINEILSLPLIWSWPSRLWWFPSVEFDRREGHWQHRHQMRLSFTSVCWFLVCRLVVNLWGSQSSSWSFGHHFGILEDSDASCSRGDLAVSALCCGPKRRRHCSAHAQGPFAFVSQLPSSLFLSRSHAHAYTLALLPLQLTAFSTHSISHSFIQISLSITRIHVSYTLDLSTFFFFPSLTYFSFVVSITRLKISSDARIPVAPTVFSIMPGFFILQIWCGLCRSLSISID